MVAVAQLKKKVILKLNAIHQRHKANKINTSRM